MSEGGRQLSRVEVCQMDVWDRFPASWAASLTSCCVILQESAWMRCGLMEIEDDKGLGGWRRLGVVEDTLVHLPTDFHDAGCRSSAAVRRRVQKDAERLLFKG